VFIDRASGEPPRGDFFSHDVDDEEPAWRQRTENILQHGQVLLVSKITKRSE
jgi:hypothetical protein